MTLLFVDLCHYCGVVAQQHSRVSQKTDPETLGGPGNCPEFQDVDEKVFIVSVAHLEDKSYRREEISWSVHLRTEACCKENMQTYSEVPVNQVPA